MSSSSSRGPEFPLPPLAIGIDLGTSYCSVAVYENQKVTIIQNEYLDGRTPSYVAFTDTERFIGNTAKHPRTMNPMNIIFDTLRLIGRKFEDPLVQGFMKHWSFEVISDDDGMPRVSLEVNHERKTFSPEQICSILFAKMKTTAEKHLGRPVTDAVVTVPVDFSHFQRQAITVAATIAGLKVLRLLLSPVAAAIAYYYDDGFGIHKFGRGVKNVLVFDLGGATLDLAILTTGQYGIFELKSTASDSSLGGEDFVNRMLTHFVTEIIRKHGKNITRQKTALLRLRNACEIAMQTLSDSTEALIEIRGLFDGIDFHEIITREWFEQLNADLFRRSLEPLENCLRVAKMEKTQIDDIILVGGSTRIPKIRELLKQFFDGKELMEKWDVTVAYGAALYAAVLANKSKRLNGTARRRQSKKRKVDGRLQACDAGSSGSRKSNMNEDAAEDLTVIDLVDIYRPYPLKDVAQDSIASVNKKIMQEEIATDFGIVCESGAKVKCHKVFLCAQSEILRALIESDGANNELEMGYMSEESVKAFLAFLYYRDTTEASKNFAISMELIRAAQLYDIESLEVAMEEMILTKETSRFGVDHAVRLFAFARRMENGEDLKMKAAEILKRNISNLNQSDCYKELYRKDPESAMDLFQCAV